MIQYLKEVCAKCNNPLMMVVIEDDPDANIRYDKYIISCDVCRYSSKPGFNQRQAAQKYFDLMMEKISNESRNQENPTQVQ